ncbi:uncharacterized protein N7446_012858 [Penicillium canescens]|uniref:DUF4396 domain-containing protein n=1 Tax=Penicillium canescens TaxID=5083 RepID=A0AAD6HXY1_PENCN|nr:uncharacterized protein N7446_012858 [Penicillium canescens]KAJ6022507.1 hypothetical protein N7460_012902 [Penicillium canescens]KAJ6026233.1 hypothetical protein N7444_013912 [Penicillium canescens]KAJ6041792.1 hypothetical protein N7446_012858 [Penicillium canescens]
MNPIRHSLFTVRSPGVCWASIRPFSSIHPTRACHKEPSSNVPQEEKTCKSQTTITNPSSTSSSTLRLPFWTCKSTWRRAGINTLRCLVGCTTGDFAALWVLQTYYPELGMSSIMAMSMASGITTSIILETVLLHRGADQLPWVRAARTAMGMSMVSMLAMEIAENAVDYHLTGGLVAFGDPKFWLAAIVSMGAGYLAPLPYNYLRLRKYGKACH